MRQAHEGMTGGHYGAQRSIDQLQRRDFWYGWQERHEAILSSV